MALISLELCNISMDMAPETQQLCGKAIDLGCFISI